PPGAIMNVRLFFTNAEFDALKAADPSITSPANLAVVKQPASGSAPASYIFVAGEQTIFPQSWAAVSGGYYIEIEVNGFSNFYIFKSTASTLPVRWLGIQAQWQNTAEARITWQVADQVNVRHYVVRHSLDGVAYTDACTVPANNNTQYNCTVPATAGHKNYYRVMQEDLSGRKGYSTVVWLQATDQPSLTIYPNPVKDKLYLAGGAGFTTYQIADQAGRIVQEGRFTTNTSYIPTYRLPAGSYLFKLLGNGRTAALKFIKE
ncbi:MAG TPA: T9SS type A sorting domain-containing protein, partial [Flavisolibacter sp.]